MKKGIEIPNQRSFQDPFNLLNQPENRAQLKAKNKKAKEYRVRHPNVSAKIKK